MMKRRSVVIVAFVVAALAMIGQEKAEDRPKEVKPQNSYKVEYVLRELQDGKAINTRSFMMTVDSNEGGEAKVGARVPVSVGNVPAQYMDIGLNIQCVRLVERDNYVSLRTNVEMSSFALPEQAASSSNTPPVLRNFRTSMVGSVPIGKQTVIGSIDDVNSTKRYEIAVTATKVK